MVPAAPRPGGPRFAVVGLGNRIQGDEALGAIVIERLGEALPPRLAGCTDLVDGGTVGLGLLPYLERLDGLIVVDVVDHAAAPGSMIDMDLERLRPAAEPLGVHQLGAAELLGALLLSEGLPPRLRVIGLQPDHIGLGTELSPALSDRLPDLLTAITGRLAAWADESESIASS